MLKYSCNKSTVIRAYKELEMNHKIYAIPRSGYYLVEKNSLNNNDHPTIDFAGTVPDPKLLPYKGFNHCINRAVELYKDNLFSYSDVQGLESLREVLADHFSEYQIFTSKEKIFKFEDIKLFYTIPRFHNPLGTNYLEKEKKKIVELANKYDVYVVEDDYLRESLESLDTSGVECFIPITGFFVWIKFCEKINMSMLIKRLEEKYVYISPAKNFFIESNLNENSFRICISKLTKQEIKIGIQVIFEEINKLRGK